MVWPNKQQYLWVRFWAGNLNPMHNKTNLRQSSNSLDNAKAQADNDDQHSCQGSFQARHQLSEDHCPMHWKEKGWQWWPTFVPGFVSTTTPAQRRSPPHALKGKRLTMMTNTSAMHWKEKCTMKSLTLWNAVNTGTNNKISAYKSRFSGQKSIYSYFVLYSTKYWYHRICGPFNFF